LRLGPYEPGSLVSLSYPSCKTFFSPQLLVFLPFEDAPCSGRLPSSLQIAGFFTYPALLGGDGPLLQPSTVALPPAYSPSDPVARRGFALFYRFPTLRLRLSLAYHCSRLVLAIAPSFCSPPRCCIGFSLVLQQEGETVITVLFKFLL